MAVVTVAAERDVSMYKRVAAVILGICILAAAAAAFYQWFPSDEAEPLPVERPRAATNDAVPSLPPKQVEAGKVIFLKECAGCHGKHGQGAADWKVQNPDKTFPPPPHDASGHTWHHTDGLLFRLVRDGGKGMEDPGFKSAMPAYGRTLSDQEIVSVITYLKSLWQPEQRASQAEASRADPFPSR